MPTREQLIARGWKLMKSGGPYIGPRGGKWADAQHTIPWEEPSLPTAPTAPKEGKKSSMQHAIDLAKQLGIPVERSGPKSVALGGKAAFDRDLGKWNGKRGADGRRVASASKALAWLKKHESTKAAGADFAAQMTERRRTGLVLRGNTYPHREAIKAAGGVWDRIEKVWLMPDKESMSKMVAKMNAPSAVHENDSAGRTVASDNQVSYAMSLIHRLGSSWHDYSDTPAPTRSELATWTSKEIGELISGLKSEF